MSFENPTRLRIGMHGDFEGKDFQVFGRVVMGVTDGGETYYWNEFNLKSPDGSSADLVFEQTERGGEWRLFTMFEPEFPMTAADAAAKRAGDPLNLNGIDVRVTLVDSSRVYRIEGRAPEDVEVGDVANYFNAEAGDVMQVVSWTGEEVEYYNGFTLSSGTVEAAFNLPRQAPARNFASLSNDPDSSSAGNNGNFALTAFIVIGVLFFAFFGRNLSCSNLRESLPATKSYAASLPLMIGTVGKWKDKDYRITAHATVEIGEVGAVYERHEYELTDANGKVSLLVCGDKPKVKDWILFTPVEPLEPPTAKESAAQKIGDTVNVGGVIATINKLFLSTVSQMEGVAISGWHKGDVRFAYAAQSEYGTLLVCWNNSCISFYRGNKVSSKDVIVAFTLVNGK